MDSINFSVIIPLYNKENVVAQTIQSVLDQDYRNFELIVIDDGSTDRSAEVVNSILDSRIRLLQISNGGVSHARNYGAQNALYDWLFFLDGDDLLLQGSLSEFAKLIKKYPKDVAYVGKYISTDDKKYGGFIGKSECIYEKPLKAMWHKHFNPHPGNTVVLKTIFNKLGGFDERMSYYEDWEFGVRLALNYRIVFTPYVTMEYVVANNEARIKIHPIEKEMAYYVDSWNLENRWLKNMLSFRFRNFVKRRKMGGDIEGATLLQNLWIKKVGRFYWIQDILYRIRYKTLKYGI